MLMTDLEITKKCAEALGYQCLPIGDGRYRATWDGTAVYMIAEAQGMTQRFDPLHDDAQAMELVKKLRLNVIASQFKGGHWVVNYRHFVDATSRDDLNRAICECVAILSSSDAEGRR